MHEKRMSFLDLADEAMSEATREGVLHLYTEDESLNGRQIHVRGRSLINFGSCSYLGLEKDPRLIEACIQATERFGTQFSSSRGYVSSGQYLELEGLFVDLFRAHCLVMPTTTLAHMSAIPALIEPEDAVILDHQVHASVQTACQLIKARGGLVDMVKHSDLNQLESKLKQLRPKHARIWYCIDGVYSMFGDCAPIDELYQLLDRYPQLHLYVDDAHGFSWAGKRGKGTVRGHRPHHERMVLTVSLNKAFGAAGGLLVFPNIEMKRRVRSCGGGVVFSGPIQPPLLGAAIASAKIHVSGEVEVLQQALQQRIQMTRDLLQAANLPDVANEHSPVFFIGVGQLQVGFNLVRRLFAEGYYTNIGMFPAVPINKTGIRFTTTVHQTEDDLRGLVEAMAYHLPLALRDEQSSLSEVRRAFKLPTHNAALPEDSGLSLQTFHTAKDLPQTEWDKRLGAECNYDVKGLIALERSFLTQQENVTDQDWAFRYFVVRDDAGRIVLATFATHCLMKSDMFSAPELSEKAERVREQTPEDFVSSTIMLGSVVSEGAHLFVDREHEHWQEAVNTLLRALVFWRDARKADSIVLRDFVGIDEPLDALLHGKSFVRLRLPDGHKVVEPMAFADERFIDAMSYDKRRHWREKVAPFISTYSRRLTPAKQDWQDEEKLNHWYQLYLNVRNKALDINTFDLPKRLFQNLMQTKGLEAMELVHVGDQTTAAVVFQYWNGTRLCPLVLGMDYRYLEQGIYRQALYQVRQRAIELGSADYSFGFGASLEKRRMGAEPQETYAYIQANTTFDIEALDAMT